MESNISQYIVGKPCDLYGKPGLKPILSNFQYIFVTDDFEGGLKILPGLHEGKRNLSRLKSLEKWDRCKIFVFSRVF